MTGVPMSAQEFERENSARPFGSGAPYDRQDNLGRTFASNLAAKLPDRGMIVRRLRLVLALVLAYAEAAQEPWHDQRLELRSPKVFVGQADWDEEKQVQEKIIQSIFLELQLARHDETGPSYANVQTGNPDLTGAAFRFLKDAVGVCRSL